MYDIVLSRQADRHLDRVDRIAQNRIIDRLDQLAQDPLGPFTKPLTHAEGLRSIWVGTWRIVYRIDEAAQEVLVSDIASRGDVYRWG
jgi:mRNA interferase RelE/StbE